MDTVGDIPNGVTAAVETVGVRLSFLIHSDVYNNESIQFLNLRATGKQLDTRIRGIYI